MDIKKEIVKKARFVKRRGLRGLFEAVGIAKRKNDFIEGLSFIMRGEEAIGEQASGPRFIKTEPLTVNWYIDEPRLISWEANSLLRIIGQLESPRLHNRICLFDSQRYRSDEKSFDSFLERWYRGAVDGCEIVCDSDYAPTAQIAIATSWRTAYVVNYANYTKRKYYFLAQYEPLQFPEGSYKSFVENSFDLGLKGISIGSFVSSEIKRSHEMELCEIPLGFLPSSLRMAHRDDSRRRIAFYANSGVSTFNYILGMMVLKRICNAIPDIEIVYLGDEMSYRYSPAQKSYDLGLLNLDEYSMALSQCDMFLYLSVDNPNELPLVAMAVGSVPVLLNLPNNSWFFDGESCLLVDPDPGEIANAVIGLYESREELVKKSSLARRFAFSRTWSTAIASLEECIMKDYS